MVVVVVVVREKKQKIVDGVVAVASGGQGVVSRTGRIKLSVVVVAAVESKPRRS